MGPGEFPRDAAEGIFFAREDGAQERKKKHEEDQGKREEPRRTAVSRVSFHGVAT